MAEKKRRSTGHMLTRLLLIIPTVFSFVNNITSLISYEARLATQNLVKIIILAIMTACMLITVWFCLLAVLFLYLIQLQLSWLLAGIIVLGLNLILLLTLILLLSKAKNTMFFSETRKQLFNKQ
jgi:hypothetical protein